MVYPNRLKFTKDGIYELVGEDTYVNNQGELDCIAVERWQKYFIPIDGDVDISEALEILSPKEFAS
jgi:hypothetical protein